MGIEKILEQSRHPHNFGIIEGYTHMRKEVGGRCKDVVEMFVKIEGRKITDISFIGESCAICTASASLLTDYAKGKSINKIKKMGKEDILKLMKIKLHSDKLKCAMVPLQALQKCINNFEDD
ncbi:MAG: iron-sulfur cluster assembly scaffold protein [Candidatus Aenigmarchaeota archaeon]|nr:iron-sulfur cluster assembly scaffold protein [Candidatus Aenigmarchaeota archaeon]